MNNELLNELVKDAEGKVSEIAQHLSSGSGGAVNLLNSFLFEFSDRHGSFQGLFQWARDEVVDNISERDAQEALTRLSLALISFITEYAKAKPAKPQSDMYWPDTGNEVFDTLVRASLAEVNGLAPFQDKGSFDANMESGFRYTNFLKEAVSRATRSAPTKESADAAQKAITELFRKKTGLDSLAKDWLSTALSARDDVPAKSKHENKNLENAVKFAIQSIDQVALTLSFPLKEKDVEQATLALRNLLNMVASCTTDGRELQQSFNEVKSHFEAKTGIKPQIEVFNMRPK